MTRPNKQPDALARMTSIGETAFGVVRELYDGLRTRSLPVGELLLGTCALQVFVLLHWDRMAFSRLSLAWIYPTSARAFVSYYVLMMSAPFLVWALVKRLRRRRLMDRLRDVFHAAGLKNNLGNVPKFIFDRPVDPVTRKLRVSSGLLPLTAFRQAKEAIEAGLQVYVDEIREVRNLGAIEIIYAHESMPPIYKLDPSARTKSANYCIGTTRSKPLVESLDKVPHLLVAGQTGGGKSTFLRQFITTLFVGPEKMHFLLIDLKGGLEFQLFEKLPRVEVPDNMAPAIQSLTRLSSEVDRRLALLKEHHCTDIPAYRAYRSSDKGKGLPDLLRHIVVVDEAAEMFLAGTHASGGNVQHAKRILSRIARQGRSIGIHLVIATQRPDSRALDPQVKANLPGVLCFQMVNDISSITVLGNGRATDLPPIPGRAIWKHGSDFVEVQTPFMTPTEADGLLASHRTDDSEGAAQAAVVETNPAQSRKETR